MTHTKSAEPSSIRDSAAKADNQPTAPLRGKRASILLTKIGSAEKGAAFPRMRPSVAKAVSFNMTEMSTPSAIPVQIPDKKSDFFSSERDARGPSGPEQEEKKVPFREPSESSHFAGSIRP